MSSQADQILKKIAAYFSVNPTEAIQVGGSVQICVSEEAKDLYYTFHCGPSFDHTQSQTPNPDATISMKAKDSELICTGGLNAQRAFLEKRIQVTGNASIARVFSLYLREGGNG